VSRRPGRRRRATDPEAYPPFRFPEYSSTKARAPSRDLLDPPWTLSELTGPGPALADVAPEEADLTRSGGGIAMGERIVVTGRVLDDSGAPSPRVLIEIWQANAAGRYAHERDDHDAPLDQHFSGVGRCVTDETGTYRFVTIRPGAYPWKNHPNAWRPAHIHFSLLGPTFGRRLVTQMYFPGDPLQPLDPIFNSVPDPAARERLVAAYAHDVTVPEWALGFRFDIVLGGPAATPFEPAAEHAHA
jgi:protocatechuate 3,4-dioxygenase beta subunit